MYNICRGIIGNYSLVSQLIKKKSNSECRLILSTIIIINATNLFGFQIMFIFI
jgi:hypothetical protein